jgi:hypothetical protein
MSIPLINTSSDEVNLSPTFSQERLTCILLILALCVRGRPINRNGRLIGANFNVFITIVNRHFWTPFMADYIALHEETAWQADYLLWECSKEPR